MKKLVKNPIIFLAIVVIFIIIIILYAQASLFFSSGKPSVVLITAGSLRPSHLSCYGYPRIQTKTIDEFAEKGVLFKNAYCSVPLSLYSYSAILAGKNAGSVINKKGDRITLDPSYKLISEHLKSKGYSTIATVSHRALLWKLGLEKGFDSFENVLEGLTNEEYSARSEKVTKKAIELFKQYRGKRKPIFLWVEYSIPQFPYILPETFKEDPGDFPYDRQVLLLNSEISKLMEGLKRSGLRKNSIIIFTATNGESFNEHNEPTHSIFVYDSSARVPLIIKFPNNLYNRKAKIDEFSSHVDIVPTILDSLGISYKAQSFDGISLLPYLKQEGAYKKQRSIYLESLVGYFDFAWSPVVAIVSGDYKYIQLPKPELYDLKKDPHELNNIAQTETGTAELLKSQLLSYLNEKRPEIAKIIDKGADPKDKIELIRPQLVGAVLKGKAELIIAYYKELLAKDPNNKSVKFILAKLYLSMKNMEAAKPLLLELIQQDPEFNKAWEILGQIYQEQKEDEKAIESYKKALSIAYDMPVSLNNLAWMYTQKGGDLKEALKYAQRANELSKDNPYFLDTLAEVNIKMGNKAKALELIKKASEVDPKSEYLKNRLAELQK